MRGKDGKTLEESMMSGFSDVEAILKYTKQNRTDIQKLNKKMEKSYQKLGIESMMHLMKWVVNSVSHLQCWTIIILVGSSMRCTAEKAALQHPDYFLQI